MLSDNPDYRRNADRKANYSQLKPILDEAFLQRSRDEWLAFFEQNGVPCGSVDTVADVAASEQVGLQLKSCDCTAIGNSQC